MRMKNRWIGGLALATALLLGACAPPNQGAGESPSEAVESSPPAESMAPSESPEAMESTEASEASASAAPTPDDYEY